MSSVIALAGAVIVPCILFALSVQTRRQLRRQDSYLESLLTDSENARARLDASLDRAIKALNVGTEPSAPKGGVVETVAESALESALDRRLTELALPKGAQAAIGEQLVRYSRIKVQAAHEQSRRSDHDAVVAWLAYATGTAERSPSHVRAAAEAVGFADPSYPADRVATQIKAWQGELARACLPAIKRVDRILAAEVGVWEASDPSSRAPLHDRKAPHAPRRLASC